MEEISPVWDIEDGFILTRAGDTTVGFRVLLPEIFTLGEQQFEQLHDAWLKALRLLPAGIVLYKQDWFTVAKYAADFSSKEDFLERSSERFFAERPYLDHDCFLFITLPAKNRRESTSATSSILRKHLVPAELLDDRVASEFTGLAEQFVQVLADTNLVRFNKLDDTALTTIVNRYMRLADDGIARDVQFTDKIQVGENHCVLFTLSDVHDLPNVCGPVVRHDQYSTDKYPFPVAFASPLGQLLSCNHIYSQYVIIQDPSVAYGKLESKKLRLQSLSNYSRENAIARDAVNEFLNEAIGSQRQPVLAHFNLLAWSKDGSELRQVKQQCAAALAKLDVRPKIETAGAAQIWWAGIPGNAAEIPVNDCFLTFSHQAFCFLNLETNYRSSVSPIGIRLADRISGKPLHIDISDEPMRLGLTSNRNKIAIGPSGSGKSFFTNYMLHAYHVNGSHIVVVDMGNSYAGLCEMLGGYYFTYNEQKPIAFNPFYLDKEGPPDTEKKESIKTLLVALWKKEDESFMRSEYVALSNALQLYYDRGVPFRCFDSFYEFLRDEYVGVLELQRVKQKDFDVANFLYVLRPYYKGGEFDYLLNASANLDVLKQRFIVFEIDVIKDHPILFPVVTIIIMELFISKMRALQGVRKIILIEEAWKAIAKAGMAEYIKYLYKTVRKYFGESILVSQDLDDMLSSEIIRQTIINNADIKILLDMSKYQNRFEEIQQMLGLPDSEVPKILSLNKANDPLRKYKEVYIWPLAKVFRVEVSPEEYLCYTTEESEKVKVQEATLRFGSLERGIRSLVMVVCFLMCSVCGWSQVPVVGEIIGKVVKAVDLKIQKLQMEQLWLQHAQKLIENKLHELKLKEISEWSQKQKELYRAYYDELKDVREVIVTRKQLEELKRQNVRP